MEACDPVWCEPVGRCGGGVVIATLLRYPRTAPYDLPRSAAVGWSSGFRHSADLSSCGKGCRDAACATMSRVGSFLIKVGVNAVAIWLATLVVPGIGISAQEGETGTVENILTFLVIGLIFGLVNAVIKPIVKVLSLPFYIITLGLFALLVNAFMLQITEWISEATPLTFYIDEFFWDAVLAAIVVTFVSMILNLILPDGD